MHYQSISLLYSSCVLLINISRFHKSELEGLSEDFISNLEKDKEQEGYYYVSLKYPELFPVLDKCRVEGTRKKMEYANSTKCKEQNTPLLEEILQLRQGNHSDLLYFSIHMDNSHTYIYPTRLAYIILLLSFSSLLQYLRGSGACWVFSLR